MRRVFLLLILIYAGRIPLFAIDWPLETIIVTATFGEHRGDHFHSGIDLGGGEQSVYPISPGELVFSYREDLDFSSLPIGLGNFIVLQHQGGIRSLYSHLQESSLDSERKLYDRSESLGIVGSSGYSSGKHLHLSIIDSQMGTIINPLLLLPPRSDSQPPVIKEVMIRSGQDMLVLEEGMRLRSGEVEVYGNLYDLREDVTFLWKLAPYEVFLSQDGREISSFIFDSIHTRSGQPQPPSAAQSELVLLNSEKSFDDIYYSDWLFRLGQVKLIPGETSLTVIASDFSGNESSRNYTLIVVD